MSNNAHAAATAVAKTHNGTDTLTVNINEPVFLYAKDSYGGTGNDYGSIRDYEWDFNSSDGVGYGEDISAFTFHRYSTTGTYTVTLRVTDDEGNKDTDTVKIIVQNIPAGDTYYVNKNGNDSNGCTNDTNDACFTIGGALNKPAVGGGDTIIVSGGTYSENISFNKSGYTNKPISIKGKTGETVKLTPTSGIGIDLSGESWITLEGLELDGNNSAATAIYLTNTSSHIKIKNCFIHDFNSSSKRYSGLVLNADRGSGSHTNAPALWTYVYNTTVTSNNSVNVIISSWGNVFEKCKVTDTDREDNISINRAGFGNYFTDMIVGRSGMEKDAHQDEFEVYGAENVTIINSYIYNFEAELMMADGAVRETDVNRNLVFVNNIVTRAYPSNNYALNMYDVPNYKIFNNTFYGRMAAIRENGNKADDCPTPFGQVRNNIFYSTSGSPINSYRNSITISNNNYYGYSSLELNSDSTSYGSFVSDPLFEEPIVPFSLDTNSPSLDAGLALDYARDKYGTYRPQGTGWDIGAHEKIDKIGPMSPIELRIK